MINWASVLVTALLFANVVQADSQDLFGSLPVVSQVSISPDGKNLVSILNAKGKSFVAVAPFGKKEVTPLVGLEEGKYRIEAVRWINDDRVLARVTQPEMVEIWGRHTRVRLTTLYSISSDGKSIIELKKRGSVESDLDLLRADPRFLSVLPEDDDHILVEVADPRDDYFSSVFKVDVNTGDFEKYISNSLRIFDWGIDRKGEVRIAYGRDRDPDSRVRHVYFRKTNDDSWEEIASFDNYDDESFYPFVYESSTHSLLVMSNRNLGRNAIWRYSLDDDEFSELVGEAPDPFDIQDPIFWRKNDSREFIGFSYVDNFVEHVYLDKSRSDLHRQMRLIFERQGLKAHIASQDDSGSRFVIYAVSDESPGKYYLYDESKKSLDFWFSQYPQLESRELAKVEPFSFEASDGMKLSGYLTRPDGISDAPLVVFPHGGPHARDSQYFDPWVQMFADSGFAVLQVNFRGSTGFGSDYLSAGFKQWGGAMQRDVIDAVDWVEANQLADTSRACVVGASYGGYVALTAGFKTPKKFDCIVSLSGVSDIKAMMSFDSVRGANKYYKKQLADIHSSEDMKRIRDNSPVNFVEKFEAPVLLIHGGSDTRVSVGQSKMMAKALRSKNKEVSMEILEGGTHYFNEASNRRIAMSEVSKFLNTYLK